MQKITSRTNPTIKAAKKLLQKKYRKSSYLIEGWHLVEEALQSGAEILQIFVLEDMAERLADFSNVIVVTPEILKDLSDSPSPQGIVAEVAFSEKSLPDTLSGRYLFLEDVQDPGNVGTIIRTADAAGFDGVFLSDKTADIYNQKTLRSMQGSHFHLPIWRNRTSDTIALLKASAVPILATTLSKDSIDYRQLPTFDSFALVMGNEGNGISENMLEEADKLVHITMPGQAESLNVAVAAGILIFSLI
ncbi:TrmH family RNA methyltransferase [Streptococcus hillyeri]|uniref:RNA methyltransferase n=1 Tax=Streptococcus hillyeri TaxID=2282420 RepID=A0A3L9DW57_9STRE|nr:RNA methyltransferase [Streptococcus hillyeri]RLY04173.1 RNA methyltransferase [Streptococcus hillyeri]